MSQKQRRPDATNIEAPDTDGIGHSLTHLPSGSKRRVADLLRAVLALVESTSEAEPNDDLLTLAQVQAEYDMGRAALDARGVPRARVGRAYRWRRSAIEAAIQAQPVAPRPPRKAKPIADDEDPLEQMIASGAVVARGRR